MSDTKLIPTMFSIGIHGVKSIELGDIKTLCEEQPPGRGQFHVRTLTVRSKDQEFTLTLFTSSYGNPEDGPECLAVHTDFDPEVS